MKVKNNIQTRDTKNSEHQSKKYASARQLGQTSNNSLRCNQKWNAQLSCIKMYCSDLHLTNELSRQFN